MSLARMEQITLEHGRLLSSGALGELRYCYMVFRGAFNRLSEQALNDKVCRWPQRPKFHHAEHLYFDSGSLNPRYTSNYLSEDMVRRVKVVASGCHPAYLSRHVAFKYALEFTLRWR